MTREQVEKKIDNNIRLMIGKENFEGKMTPESYIQG